MLSLDLLDKVAKRLDFHSTTILLLDFFDKDQTSLNITRLHSTHSTRWPNGSIFSSIFCRVKNRVKNRVVWPGPYVSMTLEPRIIHNLFLNFSGFEPRHSYKLYKKRAHENTDSITLTGWRSTPYISNHLTLSRKFSSASEGTCPLPQKRNTVHQKYVLCKRKLMS